MFACALALACIGLVASPMFRDPLAGDDYPLSTYPMFARDRGHTSTVTSAWATGASGQAVAIPPEYVANSETMQALQTLRKTVARGRQPAQRLCEAIAQRIVAADDERFSGLQHVEIATQRVDAIAFLAGHASPERVRLHASCPLLPGPRSGPAP